MPIRYSIDSARGRLHMTIAGEFTTAEMASTMTEIATTPALQDGFTALSDHTAVERPMSPSQIVELVGIMEKFPHRFTGTRWAIVSTRPASYGMMRVLAARVQLAIAMRVRIFFDVHRAAHWLDRDEDRQRPARSGARG